MGEELENNGRTTVDEQVGTQSSFFEKFLDQEASKKQIQNETDITYIPNENDGNAVHFQSPPPDMINPDSPFRKNHVNQPSSATNISNKNLQQFVSQPPPTDNGNVEEFTKKGDISEEDFKTNKIEDLVLLGRVEREVDFFGHKIVLQTLNGIHNIDIVDETNQFSKGTRLAASIIGILVRSLKTIDGKKLYAEDPSELAISKFQNLEFAKLWLLEMQQVVLNALYGEYIKLTELQDEKIGELKN